MSFPSPVKFFDSSMTEEILRTPCPFRRIWLHRTEVKERILLNGWNPELNKNSIYGTAVYLAEEKWNLDDFSLGIVDHPSPIDLETLKSHLRDRGVDGQFSARPIRRSVQLSVKARHQYPSEEEKITDLSSFLTTIRGLRPKWRSLKLPTQADRIRPYGEEKALWFRG